METIKSELLRLNQPEQLKQLLSSSGPCISMYFPVNRENLNPGDDERHWKSAVRELQAQSERFGGETRDLVESLTDWNTVSEDRNGKEKTLVVFRSPDSFARMWIRAEINERVAVGPQFFVRPLLPFLRDSTFYLLALSLNDVRLLCCTRNSSEQVPLVGAETNFDRYMNSAKPDHVLDNRGSTGPSSGSSKGVMFGTTTDTEDRGEYLAHYFKQIDRALNATLRENKALVIPVAVEYELSLYRSISTYPNLLDEGIHGAPNGLKGGEMHSRALSLLAQHHLREVEKVLGDYNHLVGGGRATNRLKEIVTGAHDGRVNKLVVSDSMEQQGTMDEATHAVRGSENGGGENYDLLNDAVVQTMLHAGQVYVAPNKLMPNGTPLAAIFRY
jgi:hypothetical protein